MIRSGAASRLQTSIADGIRVKAPFEREGRQSTQPIVWQRSVPARDGDH